MNTKPQTPPIEPIGKVFIRSYNNYDKAIASKNTALACTDKSRTIQSQKDETDINIIVKRFGITGELPQGMRLPMYQDYDQIFDYQTAHQALIDANMAFMAMPATLRNRFNNNPGEFLQFCSEPKNREEMIKLGFIDQPNKPPSEQSPAPAPDSPPK